jgi:hypothetical protein
MKKVLCLVIALIFSNLPFNKAGLLAQNLVPKIHSSPNQFTQVSSNDTIRILAVMVNFQEDQDETTFGNGKFGSIYSKDYGTGILDPLPHNRDYFASHLTFVKNYFHKVSNGKANIEFTILTDTFSVSQTMRNYAPSINSIDFTPLGQFSDEVWTKADQKYPGFNFSKYNLFIIFHAGVGRDISLPGSLGNERDLPSVFLSEKSFKKIYGENFDGISVSNGTFKIKNSLIIPETESRELEGITGTVLFQITINGLLTASVASYMGLPDLFDTETGLSAIGRFGLMDGQAIFAYNGVFPPEPSAWEKIFLGWAQPVEVNLGNHDINLMAQLAATLSDTVILKVQLNSSEYYLIENRQRDVFKDGEKITLKSDGSVFTRTFIKDTTGFYSYDTDSLYGVILDVDEYDWALPGNGILIWHIDDNVINEKIAENKINTDENRRGVDLEEADGIQEIGKIYTTIFGDQVVGEGTSLDLWYAGNKSVFYKNRFSLDTRPDTKTNSGANSLITIKNFSANANKMSFKVEYGDSVVKPLFNSTISNLLPSNSTLTVIPSIGQNGSSAFAVLERDGKLIINDFDQSVKVISNFSDYKVLAFQVGSLVYILGSVDSTINILSKNTLLPDTSYSLSKVNIKHTITAPLVFPNPINYHLELAVGCDNGTVYIYDFLSLLGNYTPQINDSLSSGSEGFAVTQVSSNDNDEYAFITRNSSSSGEFIDQSGKYSFDNEYPTQVVLTKNNKNESVSVVLTSNNNIYVLNGSNVLSNFHIQSDTVITHFALADLKNNGNNYIVVNNGKVEAYNLQGAAAENFPFKDYDGIKFTGNPAIADIEGDQKSEIISITEDGRIFALDGGSGKVISGFPLSTGSQSYGSSAIFENNNKLVFCCLYDSGIVGWDVSSITGRKDWVELYGNNLNQASLAAASNSLAVNEFFPTNRAYNYPNPVYNGQTAIRYYVNENSKINIKIFDLTGSFVAELHNDAIGGMDNETVWNVNDIQSGVYLARIEAIGQSGKTESAIIKIAVVK